MFGFGIFDSSMFCFGRIAKGWGGSKIDYVEVWPMFGLILAEL